MQVFIGNIVQGGKPNKKDATTEKKETMGWRIAFRKIWPAKKED